MEKVLYEFLDWESPPFHWTLNLFPGEKYQNKITQNKRNIFFSTDLVSKKLFVLHKINFHSVFAFGSSNIL
jgi:hypothetical protein